MEFSMNVFKNKKNLEKNIKKTLKT